MDAAYYSWVEKVRMKNWYQYVQLTRHMLCLSPIMAILWEGWIKDKNRNRIKEHMLGICSNWWHPYFERVCVMRHLWVNREFIGMPSEQFLVPTCIPSYKRFFMFYFLIKKFSGVTIKLYILTLCKYECLIKMKNKISIICVR